jgi:aminodeoxyfutalosine synthase
MPVSDQEITSLAASHDIISVGMVADDIRRQRHGVRTTFVRVAEVSSPVDAPIEWPPAAGEIRIAGAPVSRTAAIERVRQVVSAAGSVPVSAYSLADLETLAAQAGVTLRELLEELRAVGLGLVAEAPFDRLQAPNASIEQVSLSGLMLARLTVHQIAPGDPLLRLRAVSALQRAVGVIRTFAPLPRRINPAAPTTGFDDVRHIALARVVVENIPSIQVDWALYGPKLAQVALTVGADDVDAVSAEDGTTEGRRRAPLEEIRRHIRAASQQPIERDGRFDLVAR